MQGVAVGCADRLEQEADRGGIDKEVFVTRRR